MLADFYNSILLNKVRASGSLAPGLDGKEIFIAGASGFLAANLIAFLDALRWEFSISLTLRVSSRRPFDSLPLWRFTGRVPEVVAQVADVETTELSGKDLTVVHAASYGAPADYMRHPLGTFRSNTSGVCALLDQSPTSNIRHFVYISSAEIYGQPRQEAIPTPEDYAGSSETTQPRSIYPESKRMGEVLSATLCQSKQIPLTILRPWNLYGPGQRYTDSRVPIQLMRQCKEQQKLELQSDGSPSRSFCYVLDGVAQMSAALSFMPTTTNVFNIGNGSAEISIAELAQECLGGYGLPPSKLSLGSGTGGSLVSRSCPDIRRITSLCPSLLNQTPLSDGLQSLREWVDFLASEKWTS